MAMDNPYQTGPAFRHSFNVDASGLTQGDAQDDPAIRLTLCAGVVADDVKGTLWGGMGIIESTPKSEKRALGSVIKPAAGAQCTGFSVFNQALHGVVTPNNGVPQFMAGNGIHFYRLGSGARIPLPVSAAVAALADGKKAVNANKFIWDAAQNCIDIAKAGTGAEKPATAPEGMSLRLLYISPTGNLVAKQDATSKDVNWDDAPLGLFEI